MGSTRADRPRRANNARVAALGAQEEADHRHTVNRNRGLSTIARRGRPLRDEHSLTQLSLNAAVWRCSHGLVVATTPGATRQTALRSYDGRTWTDVAPVAAPPTSLAIGRDGVYVGFDAHGRPGLALWRDRR
jgi:hypothetical protein